MHNKIKNTYIFIYLKFVSSLNKSEHNNTKGGNSVFFTIPAAVLGTYIITRGLFVALGSIQTRTYYLEG